MPVLLTRKDYADFACGFGSAVVNVSLTYPIHKVIFRQMINECGALEAVRQLRSEGGVFSLYRGFLPPLCQKAIAVSVMFGCYNTYRTKIQDSIPRMPHVGASCLASLMAGTTEAMLTPFERIQTLLQDKHHQAKFSNTYQAVRMLRPFGAREFYRGFTAILLRNGPSNFIFFELRGEVKSRWGSKLGLGKTWYSNMVLDFVSGGLVGGLISTLIYPINLVKCKMQLTYGTPYASFLATFRQVYAERDRRATNLFYGVRINFTRALISWGIINASYEFFMKTFFPDLRID